MPCYMRRFEGVATKMEKYYYISGADNAEFWRFSQYLTKKGENIGFRWSGPYAVTTYKIPSGTVWEIWDDADNGIPYSIERIS